MSCYKYEGGTLLQYGAGSDYSPCGPVNATTAAVPCCVGGDACLSGGLCFYTHSLDGGTGYYAAGCTDSSFSDTHCRELCDDQPIPDVVYDSSRALWACCGSSSDGAGCSDPTNETFNLAAPADLDTYFQIPKTGFAYTSVASLTATSSSASASTSTSSTSSAAASTTTTSTASPSTSNGISKGAMAGIGVGVAVTIVLFAAVLWYFLRKKRRRSAVDGPKYEGLKKNGSHSNHDTTVYSKPELSGASPVHAHRHQMRLEEMSADLDPRELEA